MGNAVGVQSQGNTDATPQGRFGRATRGVPIRTIIAVDVVAVATVLAAALVWELRDLILLGIVAGFIALVLEPGVALLGRAKLSRGWATTVVVFVAALLLTALVYVLARPVVSSATRFVHELPSLVKRAEAGKGRVGRLLVKLHALKWVKQNAPKLGRAISGIGGPALNFGRKIVDGIVDIVTIVVLAVFILLDAPRLGRGLLSLLSPQRAREVSRVSSQVSSKVTGYLFGNALTSVVAGCVILVTLEILRVPFAPLLALWVALVDLLPLVGGLIAGIPTVGVAFLHSVPAGIVSAVVFVVYQEFENHVLNPVVMGRTVRLNPLWVFVSVLIGAKLGDLIGSYLGGFLGALLAIPAAGAIQVLVKELRHPSDVGGESSDVGGESSDVGGETQGDSGLAYTWENAEPSGASNLSGGREHTEGPDPDPPEPAGRLGPGSGRRQP